MEGMINLRELQVMNEKVVSIKPQGFTLIELLIALAISGLVITAIYNIFISNNRIYLKQNEMTKIEQNLRAVMHVMAREVRMAGYKNLNSTITGINATLSNSTSITFNYEDEHNGFKELKFSYDASQKRIENKNGQALANHVGDLVFSYFNSTCSDIDRVDIYLESFTSKDNLDIPMLSMNKTVKVRNACLGE